MKSFKNHEMQHDCNISNKINLKLTYNKKLNNKREIMFLNNKRKINIQLLYFGWYW